MTAHKTTHQAIEVMPPQPAPPPSEGALVISAEIVLAVILAFGGLVQAGFWREVNRLKAANEEVKGDVRALEQRVSALDVQLPKEYVGRQEFKDSMVGVQTELRSIQDRLDAQQATLLEAIHSSQRGRSPSYYD